MSTEADSNDKLETIKAAPTEEAKLNTGIQSDDENEPLAENEK